MALHNIDIRTLWPIFNKIYGTVFGIYESALYKLNPQVANPQGQRL